jgi:hypothetical protein
MSTVLAEKKIHEGCMEDAKGSFVPIELVKDIDKLRDQLVREIAAEAEALSQKLTVAKSKWMADIAAFVELSAEKYDVKMGGQKGNVTLSSYDGRIKILRAMADRLIFDERLQIAKQLIDDCIKEWTSESRPEIKALIDNAFEVDSQGKINTGRVLGLRKLDIADLKWKAAMQAIADSVLVASTIAYIRIYRRQENGNYKQVNLDLAAL